MAYEEYIEDYKPNTLDLSSKIYIYWAPPCDFWEGCPVSDELEREIILKLMPEDPRNRMVYKSYLPGNGCDLEVFYFCKADNNGTTYIFTNCSNAEIKGLSWELDTVVDGLEIKIKKGDK